MTNQRRIFLRPAKAGDVGYIKDLGRRVFERYGPYEEMLPDWFREGSAVTLLTLIDDEPVAFAMLGVPWRQGHMPRTAELLAIAVEPKRQHLGIGGLLMERIEKEARERKVDLLILHTAVGNTAAQKLFSRSGFSAVEMKKDFYPNGQDAIMMYKEIKGRHIFH